MNVGVNVLLYTVNVLQPGTQTCYQLDRSLSKIQNWSGHQKQTAKSLYMPENKTPVQSVICHNPFGIEWGYVNNDRICTTLKLKKTSAL